MNAPVLEISHTRAERLKQETHALHERLDTSIAGKSPFADRDSYAAFVEIQYRFYAAIEPLYRDPRLGALIPGLPARSRLAAAERDLADLGRVAPEVAPKAIPEGEALGWLYVSEGSTLGAAFLLKAVAAIGFDEENGARHMAAAPEGRGKHWRDFKDALNAVPLTPAEDVHVIAGANAAFAHVQSLVNDVMARG
ncbi:MAG: biliverdin-producing heme oxygenase [Rhizobiales bacterium]|nr:biliverdin-producing heme oxygenase [Hyphomicrobiales bacterium]